VARPRTRRASVKAAAPARKIPSMARRPASLATARRRGARHVPPGAMAGGVHERREAGTLT
jgi:hypothetical protein